MIYGQFCLGSHYSKLRNFANKIKVYAEHIYCLIIFVELFVITQNNLILLIKPYVRAGIKIYFKSLIDLLLIIIKIGSE